MQVLDALCRVERHRDHQIPLQLLRVILKVVEEVALFNAFEHDAEVLRVFCDGTNELDDIGVTQSTKDVHFDLEALLVMVKVFLHDDLFTLVNALVNGPSGTACDLFTHRNLRKGDVLDVSVIN